jgi:tetratricopeptide (TPR) repeat protein
MKRLLRSLVPALAVAAATPTAMGQAPETAETLNTEALTAMEGGQWEQALQTLDRCIEAHGTKALDRFGPSFGVTWYRKGMCEMRLQRWEAAARSFEICYRDFPNKGKLTGNRYHKRALMRWGEAARAAGRPEEALRLFKKFLAERDRQTDEFEPATYYLQVALCHFQLGDLMLGAENLETAVRNKGGFATPDTGIVAALQALVATAIAKNDENTLRAFFESNREALTMPPVEMASYSDSFVKLATDALGAGMDAAALAIFRLIPSSEVIANELHARIAAMGEQAEIVEGGRRLVKAELQARLDAVEQARREGTTHEVVQLEATAAYNEKQGDLAGARGAFAELIERFPRAQRRADHQFHLVRTSAALGEPQEVEKHAAKFLQAFPDSVQAPAVQRMLLVSLFEKDQHQSCITTASAMLPSLPEGSPEHDLCLRVLAGSYQQTGRFEEARPLLDRHVSLYPASPYAQAMQYLRASNLVELRQWAEAGKLLDDFIAKHPDAAGNPYFAAALLDRAECHASLNENGEALEKLTRLEKEFPGSEVLANAQGLKGELLLRLGQTGEAEESLTKALAQAEKQGRKEDAAEILLHLVVTIGGKNSPRQKEALPYCDRFWKSYAEFPELRPRMVIAQADAMVAGGRSAQALEQLRECIVEGLARSEGDPPEAAIRVYARLCAKEHGTEKLRQDFLGLPGLKPEDKAARVSLRVAVIEQIELRLNSDDQAAKEQADAQLKSLYQELKSEFEPKDLPTPILLRTGDFLRTRTSAPRQALPYYAEVLARNVEALRFPALLGRAAILAEGSKEERAGAIQDLQEIAAGTQDARDREDALYWLIMTRMKDGDFAAAAESATLYLSPDSGFQRLLPEVRLALARSLQERGMIDEALAAYAKVWSEAAEATRVSVTAMRIWMQMSWTRNAPSNGPEQPRSDRQAAYDEGLAFLEKTKPLFDQMASIDQESWLEIEKLVTEFAATTDVKPVAKQGERAPEEIR